MPILDLQDQTLQLDRYPLRPDDPWQPWDAADEYLLNHLRESGSPAEQTVLVVNDGWGALVTALHHRNPTTWYDSHLSLLALRHNMALNGLSDRDITFVAGDQVPSGIFNLVLLKIPKSMAYLEDILFGLRDNLQPGSRLVAGGMIKHTPARAYRLMEKIIGPVRTSLGWKKARLATATFDPELNRPDRPPVSEFRLDEFGWTLSSRANVFSRDHLDLGTGLLLKHLPSHEDAWRVADLGCGNGVLALAVARLCAAASVVGVDESYQAVASARDNVKRADLVGRDITFAVADGLAEIKSGTLDLVVCNPPFHRGQATGDFTAWRMFSQARAALKPGGELRIVGNRHLGYHLKLKRLFGNVELLGSDRKFVVLRAVR